MIQQLFFSLLFRFSLSHLVCVCFFFSVCALISLVIMFVLLLYLCVYSRQCTLCTYGNGSAYKDHLYWLISIKDVNLNAINSLAYLLLCFVFTHFFPFLLSAYIHSQLGLPMSFTQIRWPLLVYFFFLLRFVAVVPLMIRTIFIIFFAQKMNKRKSLFGFCYMLKLQEEEEEEKDAGNKIQAKKENTAVFLRNKTIT